VKKIFFLILVLAVATACSSSTAPTIKHPPLPQLGTFDPSTVKDIKLDSYPVVPAISENAKLIYQSALKAGNNPKAFSKLGDCMTENPYFLGPFGAGQFDLGSHASLKGVLDYFDSESFSRKGYAAAGGFNVAGPLDSTWSDPTVCKGGESPLACEYRTHKPSIALIMFGTNDVSYTEPDAYNYYLRSIISQTLDANVLPVLSTFPTRPENPQKSVLLNQIAIKVAQDYDLPLINLSRALEPLPHHGVDPADTIHLSAPPDKRVDVLTTENLQFGFTVRNLVSLQALEAVLAAVKQ
jgi:hypothetical protein